MASPNLLYELFAYAEWKPEPDFVLGEITTKTYPVQYANHLLGLLKPEQTLVEYLSDFNGYLQPWQICLGDDGKVIAILQDTILEIRTKRGNYSSTVAKAGMPKDPNPQWRRMAWTSDCSLLAIAHSNGKVSFYDLLAINLFNIPPDCTQPPESQCMDTTHAIAGMIFLSNRIVDQKWSCELLLVDYKGGLRSYFISPTDGFKLNHTFSFEGGVSSLVHHNNHNMLFISGLPSVVKQDMESSNYGLHGWRLLNDPPFYKKAYNDKEQVYTYTSRVLSYLPLYKKPKQSIITKAVPSPNGTLLGCIHFDGRVSTWQLPALKLLRVWELSAQTGFDNPSPLTVGKRGWPPCKGDFSQFSPIDINWWNNETIILSRLNGSVSICRLEDLHNMLVDKPVFLHGRPQLTNAFDNGFLSLECEATLISPKKLRRKSDADDSDATVLDTSDTDNFDDTEDEKPSLLSMGTEVLKAPLYLITDMERFQPKPKKLNLLSRVYRLLSLKSTTPEELYLRKIENGSYDEALTLADTYKLDSDLVYQQQWRSTKVSNESITHCLTKVSKKMWVIQQCCDRVPETVVAAKELLEFGLKLTKKEIYKGVKSSVDKKTFYEENLFDKITHDELSAQSSEILRYRYTMLFYLDRLEIYRAIIKNEVSTYSSDEYNRLRSNSICKSAIEYAKEGRIEALICLWSHLNELPLRLIVLQNLPETIDPGKYTILLPDINTEKLLLDHKVIKRPIDWCEKDEFRSIWGSIGIDEFSPEDLTDEVIVSPLSTDLNEWYSMRARQIESLSGLAGHSLTLIKIAMDKCIPNLDNLHSMLLTLDILLYDINIEPLTLTQLEASSHIEIINNLMKNTTHQTIIDDIKTLLMPYLERCEVLTSKPVIKETLFEEYLLCLSSKDLSLVLVIFHDIKDLGINVQQSLDLADHCFMCQNTNENLSLCFDILEALPETSDESITPSLLIKGLDTMERILNACQLMENHGITISYPELKSTSGNDKDNKDLLIRLSRSSNKSHMNAADWNQLLTDLLNLHSFIFTEANNELCHEIFTSALISSGNKPSIMSAEQMLTCQPNNGLNNVNKSKLPFKLNVTYKISYEKSVSLVLQSAREYYNSASSLNDPALDNAWVCLNLIKERDDEISLEKDLISALKILHEFEWTVLPIHVRFNISRIEFIEECLNCHETAYKSTSKILELAKLIRVASNDEKKREILITSLCAIKALEFENYEESRRLGERLITISEGPSAVHSATAAQQLGANPNVTDLPLRHRLLNLAILHCEPQHLENLLQIRSSVESGILQSDISNLVSLTSTLNVRPINLQDSIESTDDDYDDALTSPMVENKMITGMQTVEKLIQKPLSVFGDKKNWKNALNFSWINDNKPAINEVQNKNMGKLACHAFYSHMHENCFTSMFATQYDKFSTPDMYDPQFVMLYSLIRNNLLIDCVKYGSADTTHTEAFVQCSDYTLPEDTAFCISQLLSVCHSEDFNRNLSKSFLNKKNLVLDITTVNTLLYFYALAIYIDTNPLPDEGFIQSPLKLIYAAMQITEKLPDKYNNDFVDGFIYCKNLMAQLIEGKKLVNLGCNVNIELFAQDANYRRNAILALSRTENNNVYQLAVELAKKYDIDEKELLYNYLSYIITNHKNIEADCNEILTNETIIKKLNEDSQDTIERLNECIWKALDGKDHQGLMLYFNLIASLNHRHLINGMNAKDHVKLIKKTKSACPGLDYKYILTNPQQDDLFETLMPLLTKDNIGLITKLLRNLPNNLNFQFNSSNLYREWLLKIFYVVPDSAQSSKKWMQQHRECSSYFSKLNKEDLLVFTDDILFSSTALQKLPSGTRTQIAFQTADYCQHEHQNNENISFHNKNDDGDSWEEIGSTITKWGKFLESFHSDNLKPMMQIEDIPTNTWREIELSKGDACIVKPIASLALNNHFSVDNLILLLNTLNVGVSVNDVLSNIIDNIEFDSATLSILTKSLIELKLKEYPIDGEILNKMKPFTTSSLLSSKQRLDLMSLYKIQSDYNDTEMLEKISMELITNIWGDNITEAFEDVNISEALCRRDILIKLIDGDVDWEKLKGLVDLVNMWPPQNTEEDKIKMVYVALTIKLLNDRNLEENVPLFKLLLSKQKISEDDVTWIISNNRIENAFGKLWLCLLTGHERVYKTTLPKIALEINDDESKEFLNDNLLGEILKRKLFVVFARTRIYPELVQFLFNHNLLHDNDNQYSYCMKSAISDLLARKYLAEAGALKMSMSGIPQALKTFGESLLFY